MDLHTAPQWLPSYHLNTFDEVAKHYERITPLRGKNKNDDIRPIHPNRRDRKWERIMKLDDNVYALADYEGMHPLIPKELYAQTCPIIWERNLMGDFVTIRTAINGSSPSRYMFLAKFLPRGFEYLYNQAGRHYLQVHGELFYMAKMKMTYDYAKRTADINQDNHIKFKVEGERFTRVSDPLPYPTRAKDPEMKAHYDPLITSYWEWMCMMLPVLGDINAVAQDSYAKQLNVYVWYFARAYEATDVRKILEDADDSRRVAFAVLCANEIGAIDKKYQNERFDPNKDSFKKFRDLMFRMGNLYAKVYK